MRTLIINGNPEASDFDVYLEDFGRGLSARGHEVERIDLRELSLRACTGCWSCWWATPGLCSIRDGIEPLHRAMATADLVVWASPLILGNVSALLKRVQDRFVPLVHPYITIRGGECHHRPRYAKDPDIGLIVGPDAADGSEDLDLVRELFRRFSKNSRGRFRLFATTARSVERSVAEAISGPALPAPVAPAPWIVEPAPRAPRPTGASGANGPGRRRLFINGSPRGPASNSRLLLSWIAEGMGQEIAGGPDGGAAGSAGETPGLAPGAASDAAAGRAPLPVLDLARVTDPSLRLAAVADAEELLLALPLYTDSVPSIVKAFLEELAAAGPAALPGKRLAIVLQSGFPEPVHAEAAARWLARATRRLGLEPAGILIRGGVEGVRVQPEAMTRRLRETFRAAGQALAETGGFPPELARRVAGRRTLSLPARLAFRFLSAIGLTNYYWDLMLKRHGATERSFDAPYGKAYSGRPARLS